MARKDNPIQHQHAQTIRDLADKITANCGENGEWEANDQPAIILSQKEQSAVIWACFLVDDNNALFGILPRDITSPQTVFEKIEAEIKYWEDYQLSQTSKGVDTCGALHKVAALKRLLTLL